MSFFRIFGYTTKPKTLGEGLQRVVRAAGKGRSGKLISHTVTTDAKNATAKLSENLFDYSRMEINSTRNAVREYSNGVKLCYSDINSYFYSPSKTHFSLGFSGDGLLGVFNGKRIFAAKEGFSLKNELTGKIEHFCEKYIRSNVPKNKKRFAKEVEIAYNALSK